MTGSLFTWTNGRGCDGIRSRVEERLDRALCLEGWLSSWLLINCYTLPILHSDHNRIMVDAKLSTLTGSKPFRFLRIWVDHEDFSNSVARICSSTAQPGLSIVDQFIPSLVTDNDNNLLIMVPSAEDIIKQFFAAGTYYVCSSIWPGIKDHYFSLMEETRWLIDIRDSNHLITGGMYNSQYEVLLLRHIQVVHRPCKASKILEVFWRSHPPGWIKVNTDGSSNGSPGPSGCGGIFRNCRRFVKGCFVVPLGVMYAFEVELLAVFKAIEFAHIYG
ncbi:hypothetical protein Ddye_000658 [Dipteronia dyeriana]|uniref:RNase H type-1 domain-containing protein n=1 Tax=Dipteronia dyeriana TaxID=168575 RepID=A0AAD9XM45_9ROSI|nr:hypothetical protein Ddye_000658 [Dipteronia dyeriana]